MALNRIPTDGEMQILAVPVATAVEAFADPKVALLAVFTLGLDFGRKDPALATRMSEIGQAILTGGDALDEEMLDTSIALVNLLFIVEDARQANGL
jgi:hypothetical protein